MRLYRFERHERSQGQKWRSQTELIAVEIEKSWKDIPSYYGKYQAAIDSRVRRVYQNGKTRLMTPFKKTSRQAKKILRNRLYVHLTIDGKSKEVALLKIMVDAFLGGVPVGKVPYHKDGFVTHNELHNIGFIERSELGKMTGAISKRIPVAKIDRSGEPVEFYSSAREAARHNNMSYQTVLDRCNNKVKKPFELDGHNYQFDI